MQLVRRSWNMDMCCARWQCKSLYNARSYGALLFWIMVCLLNTNKSSSHASIDELDVILVSNFIIHHQTKQVGTCGMAIACFVFKRLGFLMLPNSLLWFVIFLIMVDLSNDLTSWSLLDTSLEFRTSGIFGAQMPHNASAELCL